MSLLEIEALSVGFGTRQGMVQALRGVSLGLDAGETLGVVGESGSGKSVTALAVMRLLDRSGRITGGRVMFQGRDITRLQRSDLRQMRGAAVSMIFQNPRAALNPIRSVGQQIGDVLRSHEDLSAAEARRRSLELLRSVMIRDPEQRLGAYPHELSGGMCQRVMIAMAIACAPALLIADEPTTGLDVTTQKTVMELLAGIVAARDMAMILITHDLGLAARYCDRIAVMERGVVVEEGRTASLFHQPRHEYTRRLVAASPTRRSTLADLVMGPGKPSSAGGRGLGEGGSVGAEDAVGETTLSPALSRQREREKGAGPLLEVQNVRKAFEGVVAVNGVSFRLERGGSLGLVGESGSGKSTLVRLVCRLIDADAGEIVFDGESIGAVPAREFHRARQRRDIQIVFQDPNDSLDPRKNAFDCIAHPLRRLEGLRGGAALDERVRHAASRAGLPEELLTRFPHQLSGGQKARVGIARAIAPGPRLLILDEPTAALDVSVQAVILQLLDRLRREDGIGLLFVSHDLNVVRMLCDDLVVLQSGQVVEAGPSRDVFRHPQAAYTKLLLDAVPHFEPEPMPA